MKPVALMSCMLSICLVTGCTGNPLDDLSSVPEADRAALKECLQTPDLPGNHWPQDAGKARCWLSLPQTPSLKAIAATLKEHDGADRLDKQYAEILEAHYNDPAHRDRLFHAYLGFKTAEGQPLAADWMAKSGQGPFAVVASAEAALGAAEQARGTAFADKTSDAQFAGMMDQLKVSVPLLRQVLRLEPRLSPACVGLMEVADLASAADIHAEAERQCMKVDPLSWDVNNARLTGSGVDPRWGGSFDAMDGVVEQIRQLEKDNPGLASLLAKGIGRRAYFPINDDSNLLPIAKELDGAALAAPDVFYIDRAGLAAEQAGNLPKAMLYYSQALRFAPDEIGILIHRAQLRTKMGDRTHALVDAQHAAILPDLCHCKDDANLALLFGDLGRIDDERAELQKAAKQPDDRLFALETLCKTYIEKDFDGEHALPCTKQLADEFPDDSEALYLRALTLHIVNDPAADEFDARFRGLANTSDPGQAAEIEQLDQFKKQTADKQ